MEKGESYNSMYTKLQNKKTATFFFIDIIIV